MHYVSNFKKSYNGKTLTEKITAATSVIEAEYSCDVGKELIQ